MSIASRRDEDPWLLVIFCPDNTASAGKGLKLTVVHATPLGLNPDSFVPSSSKQSLTPALWAGFDKDRGCSFKSKVAQFKGQRL